MKIDVLKVVGNACMTREDGEKLLARIRPVLERKEPVELNFTGVRFFLTHFFNGSVGPLLKNFTRDQLRDLLIFKNLAPTGRQVLKDVIEHADRWFNDSAYRKSVGEISGKSLQEA